jgi:hypothetical protein
VGCEDAVGLIHVALPLNYVSFRVEVLNQPFSAAYPPSVRVYDVDGVSGIIFCKLYDIMGFLMEEKLALFYA